MNAFEITSNSPEETQQLGRRLGEMAEPGDVFLLQGELGAGKTCLTQGIAWGLGTEEYALSPSFVIMREINGRLNLYHIDLYRLDKLEESIDLGLDDYFFGDGVCVVEWPEKAMSIMPAKHLLVRITTISDMKRKLQLEPEGQRYIDLLEKINKGLNV